MYFSMQSVKQVVSDEESELPGLGTQRSKQCSLSFYHDHTRLVAELSEAWM